MKKKTLLVILIVVTIIFIFSLLYINNLEKKNNLRGENSISSKNKNPKEEGIRGVGNLDLPKEEIKQNEKENEPKNKDVSKIELVGEEQITLKVGEEYKEQGAKAYNTKNEDISDQIEIRSNVDTKTRGTYQVTYSIGNYIVLRTVIVN